MSSYEDTHFLVHIGHLSWEERRKVYDNVEKCCFTMHDQYLWKNMTYFRFTTSHEMTFEEVRAEMSIPDSCKIEHYVADTTIRQF